MATGPCGLEFREAFSCFHYSTADPKGSDCRVAFETMQSCMSQYPALYESKGMSADDLEDDEIGKEVEQKKQPQESSEDKRKIVVASQGTAD